MIHLHWEEGRIWGHDPDRKKQDRREKGSHLFCRSQENSEKKSHIFFLMLARSWLEFICSFRTFHRNCAEVRGDVWTAALISLGCMDICASLISISNLHGLSQDLRLPVVKSCWDGGKTESRLALLPVLSNYWVNVPKNCPGGYPRQSRRIYSWRKNRRIICSLVKCGSASWYSWGSLGKTCSLFLSLKGEDNFFTDLPNLVPSQELISVAAELILSNTLSSYQGAARTKLSVKNILWLGKHTALCFVMIRSWT